MKTIKIERIDLTIARRPKGNYEAYIILRLLNYTIVLQDEIKKEDKNMTTDTITISYNYNLKWRYNTKEKLQES